MEPTSPKRVQDFICRHWRVGRLQYAKNQLVIGSVTLRHFL